MAGKQSRRINFLRCSRRLRHHCGVFMKATLAFLLLFTPVHGANLGDQHPVPFRIYTVYEREPSASIQTLVREEVDKILTPLGWDFDWKSLYRDTGLVSIRQATLYFKGECSTSNLTEYPSFPFTLGRTQLSMRHHIAPFASIYCDAIRAHVAHELLPQRPADRDAAFGRAVARVIAHELYHILCNTAAHASKGLRKATLNPHELTAEDSLYFQKNEAEKLHMQAVRYIGEWKALESILSQLPAANIAHAGSPSDSGPENPYVFSPASSAVSGDDSK